MRFMLTTGLIVAGYFIAAAVLPGCSSDTSVEPQQTSTTGEAELVIPEKMSGIAKLPAADQKAALEQEICPVAEEPLGSMGAPIKVAVAGREVFVCCDGCIEMLKANPDEYLAKLKKE